MGSSSLRTLGSAALLCRALRAGGFSGRPDGQFQVDSTAWGILALAACGEGAELLDRSRHLLMREQLPDGRLCVNKTHPASYWPTSLAVLAWHDSELCREAQQRAVCFLLDTTGFHFPRKSDGPLAHDSLLKGWPWIGETHSWVEPTALSVMALRATGYGHHDRVKEAVHMVDWIVSVAKMKTHHWTGATLSMKNLFGVMPGRYYGWPKNVLHKASIQRSILDINATLKPHFAIVDGVIGMEGDGPIMGDPKQVGVLVMGRNLPAVDATCCRIMGIDPYKVSYLEQADKWLGPIGDGSIEQRGETIAPVQTNFKLIDTIPAQQGIRLA